MANTKISNLTGAASVTDTSVFPVVDSGATKKVTGTQIKMYARSGLSTVATTGSYTDLTNKPTIFDGSYANLTGKPSLFSGSYTDLTNKPTIPADINQLTDSSGLLGQSVGASTGNITFTDTTLTSSNGDIKIHFSPTASPAVEFNFTTSGAFVFPDGTIQTTAYTGSQSGNPFNQTLNTTDFPQFAGLNVVGTLNVTNDVRQIATSTVRCQPNVDTVIYTGTDQWQHTFKLLLKIEGNEVQGQQGWDTQSCEMMIAKSFKDNKVAGSVYGLVYTSNTPLATFNARWNPTSSRVEVTCKPSSTTEYVDVRSFATEIVTSD